MNPIFEGLNAAQKEAVETLDGPLLILAGAGSGKTKTLTHRIANLIAHGVKPSNILAVTFTNKAAKEMRDRLFRILTPGVEKDAEAPRSFMPYMGTFHGICVKILRQEADAAGLDKNFVIYDMDDQISLVRRVMKNLNLNDNKAPKPKSIQGIISSEKNKGHTFNDYRANAYYENQYVIAMVFERYEEEKRKAGALDFDDILLRALELFAKNQEVRKKWQKKFEYILIDEYQDTNIIQYQLVKMLVNEKRNIAVVGDDWQSIYSWRGADFTNILHFERDFPGAKVIKLEQNYRSTGNILAASQKIINNNKIRTEKTLFTKSGDGDPVDIEPLYNETAEASFVAMQILKLFKEYPNYSNFAVLYRTNAQSYKIEKALNEMNIPYKIIGGVRFYDRKEVKDVLAILKLVLNDRDKVSLERVVKDVLSGIGEVSFGKMLAVVDSAPAGADPLHSPELLKLLSTAKAREALVKLVSFLDSVKENDNPGDIIDSVIEYFNFREITDDGTPASEERMENLAVLADIARKSDSLEDFLAESSLMSSADESGAKNSVTLMTLHAAKGLEFPVVFIVGMVDGIFPSERSSGSEAGLEEERRLAYVGITRAMKRLFLTYAKEASQWSNNTKTGSFLYKNTNRRSRFLDEIDGGELKGSLGYTDMDGDGFTDDFSDDFGGDNFDPFPEDLPVFE